ncbi:hypothetical protein VT84_17780 [Gemmata sp. SH-PL17]|uniref:hypothetical protein n=1 Tax=Gemmata sp. SH-PL17 TaxID=1630693 RepID=UPI0004BAD2C3|nr:hypothetical protein [Gemmata sp. SH-PL17]AMV26253.1 hypothetical protein VT84_17780 [Gemmata sp. SH-PL17]
MQKLKGKTVYTLLGGSAHVRKPFWGRHLWVRVRRSSGPVTDEVMKECIENQGRSGGCKVRGRRAE